MKTTLLFLAYFLQQSFPQRLKGFQFIPSRKWQSPIDYNKWLEHQRNNESTWMFDFEKDGWCARIDVKPFTLPKKWTVCYKVNHDFTDSFVFLSLLSTKSGNSLVDDFKNKTFRKMKSEGEIINLVTVFKALGWSNTWHQVGYFVRASNGMELSKVYGWKRWEQWCVAFDMVAGQIVTYVDGLYDGATVSANIVINKKSFIIDRSMGMRFSRFQWNGQISRLWRRIW